MVDLILGVHDDLPGKPRNAADGSRGRRTSRTSPASDLPLWWRGGCNERVDEDEDEDEDLDEDEDDDDDDDEDDDEDEDEDDGEDRGKGQGQGRGLRAGPDHATVLPRPRRS